MPVIRLSDVGVKFETNSGPIFPIRHINVTFPSKGLIAIKGKSGSGKSTLLNVVSSLLKPSEGKVFFDSVPISNWNEKKLSLWRLHHIGIIFQHYNLLEGMSVIDNISLPLSMRGTRRKTSLTKSEISLSMVGLSEQKDKNASLLSGGERQRVAIARAMVNDPDIVIADEPTGALDSINGQNVMEILKEISRERLVIYVSHNEEIISRFSDSVFVLEDGRLIAEKLAEEVNEIEEETQKKKSRSSSWTKEFTSKHFKNHKVKNCICFLSGLIGYSSLLLSLGFYLGSNKCIEKEETRSLEYMKSTISEKTYIDIENSPLRMVKRKRPTLENAKDAMDGIDHIVIVPDYSFFLPQYSSFSLDSKKEEGASFYPVYDMTLQGYDSSFLISGSLPNQSSINEVLVNEEFVTAFGQSLNKTIKFDCPYSFSFEGNQIEGSLSYSFLIKGVVSEFSFLNSPKVYYSYTALDLLMSETLISGGESIKSLVEKGGDSETFTGLDYYVFSKKRDTVPLIHQRLESLKERGSFLSIESPCYEIKVAFTSLTNAFSMALIIFVAVAIVGISVIEGMTCYSNFMSSKKEAAILLSLGADKGQIKSIFINESVTVSLLSGVASFLLSPLLQRLINGYIATKFSLRNLLDIPFLSFLNVPAFLLVLVILFSMMVAYVGTSLSVSGVKAKSLCQELKDE